MVGAVFVIVGVLKVKDENSRIRIYWSEAQISGSGSVPKCHESTTLPPANGKQGAIPEEMSQTLRTNKKQGNLN
jgi:hypothetical protein